MWKYPEDILWDSTTGNYPEDTADHRRPWGHQVLHIHQLSLANNNIHHVQAIASSRNASGVRQHVQRGRSWPVRLRRLPDRVQRRSGGVLRRGGIDLWALCGAFV
jgi:hypothetical protein